MARLWLALAVVIGLAGSAFAKHVSVCTCTTPRVLPAPATLDVPTNTHIWQLPRISPAAPEVPAAPYELEPHTHYSIGTPQAEFTTAGGHDDTPPIDPAVTNVSITLAGSAKVGRSPVSILHVVAATSDDTAVVRIAFVDALGEQVYWTTRDSLSACDPGFALTPGHVRVAISTYDLAGNESGTDVFEAQAGLDPTYRPSCAEQYRTRCGTPLVAIIYLAPFIGLVGLILLLVVIAIRSARSRGHSEAAPIALASLDYLARAVRLRAQVTFAMVAMVTGAASLDDGALVVAIMASPLLGGLALSSLVRWWQAHRFLRLLGYDGVTGEVHGDRAAIVVGKQVAFLRASPSLIGRARGHALPKASL